MAGSTARPAPPPISIRGTFSALRVPTAGEILLSVKAAIAVGLALLIGFSQNLENPYWSALAVYVLLTQPQAGAIRSRALFRLVGTLLGGCGAILLATLFGSHVGALLVVLIVAILLTYYGTRLDRTPANYIWLSASLTLCIIGILHVQAPETIFPFATTRMAENSLGILMILLVDSVLLPRAATPGFLETMTEWRGLVLDWAATALDPAVSYQPEARRQRQHDLGGLVALLAKLDALGVQLPYDPVARPPRGYEIRCIRLTVAHLVAHLASADLWLAAAHVPGPEKTDIALQQGEVRAWMLERHGFGDPALLDHVRRGRELHGRLADPGHRSRASAGVDDAFRVTMLLRLSDLVDHWCRLERLLHALAAGARLDPAFRAECVRARPARSIDYLLGLRDIAPLGLALGIAAIVWYATGWTAGLYVMLFAFISLAFILGTPGAAESAVGICVWLVTASGIALFYEVAVLTRVTAFPVLVAVLTIIQLPLGILMSMSLAGLLILANTFAFLALQNAYAPDAGTTLQILFAALAAGFFSVTAIHLCRFDRTSFHARRLLAAQRRDIVDVARASRMADADRLLSLNVDRVAQYATLGAAADKVASLEALFGAMRVSLNLRRLRAHEHALTPPAYAQIVLVRDAIARRFATSRTDRPLSLETVAEAFSVVAGEPPGPDRTAVLGALAGLRVTLADQSLPVPAGPGEAA